MYQVGPYEFTKLDARTTFGDLGDLLREHLVGLTALPSAVGAFVDDWGGIDVWVHNAAELWDLLVRQRGWSDERYGAWIGAQLVAALL